MGLSDKFNELKDRFSGVTEEARGKAEGMLDQFKDSQIGDQLGERAENAKDKAQESAENAKDKAQETWENRRNGGE